MHNMAANSLHSNTTFDASTLDRTELVFVFVVTVEQQP
jgi:hypothetical protein